GVHAQLELEEEVGVDYAATGDLEGDGDRSPVTGRTQVCLGWQARAEGGELVEEVCGMGAEWRELVERDLVGADGLSDQLPSDELLQTTGEQVRGDARQAIEQLAEPRGSGVQIAKDEQCPAIAHEIERAGDRTEEAVLAGTTHALAGSDTASGTR